jgi:uncharacterized protein YndB with AHSA1/START domain
MKTMDVKVSRLIPGRAAEVFDVWLDPESPGAPWFGAKRIIMTARVDGLFYWAVAGADGVHAHFGRFVAIERPRRIEHTWMSTHTRGLETTVELTFVAHGDDTHLTIVHSGLPDDEGGRRHGPGWTQFLAQLERHFAAGR